MMFSRSFMASSFIFWAILAGLLGTGNSLDCYFCYTKNGTESMEVTIDGLPDAMFQKSPLSCTNFPVGDSRYKVKCPSNSVCFRQTGKMVDNDKAEMTYDRRGCLTNSSVKSFKGEDECWKLSNPSSADAVQGKGEPTHEGSLCVCTYSLCNENIAPDLSRAAPSTCSLNMLLMFVPALLCCTETIITFIFQFLPAVFHLKP